MEEFLARIPEGKNKRDLLDIQKLQTRVKELEEENQKGKDLLIWTRDVFDNENKLAKEIITYLSTQTPSPVEPDADVGYSKIHNPGYPDIPQPPSEPEKEKE